MNMSEFLKRQREDETTLVENEEVAEFDRVVPDDDGSIDDQRGGRTSHGDRRGPRSFDDRRGRKLVGDRADSPSRAGKKSGESPLTNFGAKISKNTAAKKNAAHKNEAVGENNAAQEEFRGAAEKDEFGGKKEGGAKERDDDDAREYDVAQDGQPPPATGVRMTTTTTPWAMKADSNLKLDQRDLQPTVGGGSISNHPLAAAAAAATNSNQNLHFNRGSHAVDVAEDGTAASLEHFAPHPAEVEESAERKPAERNSAERNPAEVDGVVIRNQPAPLPRIVVTRSVLPPGLPFPPPVSGRDLRPKDIIFIQVFAALVCPCFPFTGIIAMVYSRQSQRFFEAGDLLEAQRYALKAERLILATIVAGFLFLITLIAIVESIVNQRRPSDWAGSVDLGRYLPRAHESGF